MGLLGGDVFGELGELGGLLRLVVERLDVQLLGDARAAWTALLLKELFFENYLVLKGQVSALLVDVTHVLESLWNLELFSRGEDDRKDLDCPILAVRTENL